MAGALSRKSIQGKMKTRPAFPFKLALALLTFIAACSPVLLRSQGRPDRVSIKGEVLVDDTMRNGTLEVVEVDNRVCIPLLVHADGHFELVLEAGDRAYLRFEKKGYLTKEVLVDTRNANATREALRRNRLLRFAVQMTPELQDPQLQYAAPVGHISFRKGNGLMKVEYDRRLVHKAPDGLVLYEGQ